MRERIRFDGSVERAIDTAEVLERVDELLELGADSIAVCLFNSYANPVHERAAGEAIRARHPELTVVLSHELTRRYREIDRAFTVNAEAYLRPRMRRYFDRLTEGLDGAGFDGQLFITSSDGGVMGGEQAKDRALRTLVSGCASGVSGAAAMAARSGWTDVLAIDMGGTSFDAAVIHGGEPRILQTAELAGLRFLLPMIDLVDDRGRRRLDRQCRRRRRTQRRPYLRGRGSRAGVLRPRRRAAHLHRCRAASPGFCPSSFSTAA